LSDTWADIESECNLQHFGLPLGPLGTREEVEVANDGETSVLRGRPYTVAEARAIAQYIGQTIICSKYQREGGCPGLEFSAPWFTDVSEDPQSWGIAEPVLAVDQSSQTDDWSDGCDELAAQRNTETSAAAVEPEPEPETCPAK